SASAFARGRRKVLRPVVLVPLVVVLAAGTWLWRRSDGSAGTAAAAVEQTVAVTSGTMRQAVSASGTLEPTDTESLSFAVAGKVAAVNVKAGQAVTKGAVLATVDSASLQSQVTQAQAAVESASARLSSDQSSGASTAQLTSDQANLTAAQAQLASA